MLFLPFNEVTLSHGWQWDRQRRDVGAHRRLNWKDGTPHMQKCSRLYDGSQVLLICGSAYGYAMAHKRLGRRALIPMWKAMFIQYECWWRQRAPRMYTKWSCLVRKSEVEKHHPILKTLTPLWSHFDLDLTKQLLVLPLLLDMLFGHHSWRYDLADMHKTLMPWLLFFFCPICASNYRNAELQSLL